MTVWPTTRLHEIAKIRAGGSLQLTGKHFVAAGVPAYGAGGLNGYVTTSEYEGSAIILSSIGARCGKCFYVNGEWTSLANTQVIFPDPARVDAKFLWYQLNDERRWHRSGTAQPFIKPADVKNSSVFLPSLAKQKRIADVLDRADALRTKRREARTLLDDLTQSIFLDMFGEPDGNDQGPPLVALREVLEEPLRNGLSPATAGRWPGKVLTLSAVTGNSFNAEAVKDAVFDVDPPAIKRVSRRDLLICRGSGNPQLVGRAFFPTRDMADTTFPDTMIAARVSASLVRPTFLEAVWRSRGVRTQIDSLSRTTNGTFKINQGSLETVRFSLPPSELQDSFSERMAAVLVLRAEQQVQSDLCGALLASLQLRAFSGQL